MSETIEQLRRRLAIQEAGMVGAPTPDEIAERKAAIRRGWCDENGVLCVTPVNDSPTTDMRTLSKLRRYEVRYRNGRTVMKPD